MPTQTFYYDDENQTNAVATVYSPDELKNLVGEQMEYLTKRIRNLNIKLAKSHDEVYRELDEDLRDEVEMLRKSNKSLTEQYSRCCVQLSPDGYKKYLEFVDIHRKKCHNSIHFAFDQTLSKYSSHHIITCPVCGESQKLD